MDFISIFKDFIDYDKITNFCNDNNIRLMIYDIPDSKQYMYNLKYFSHNFELRNKLLNTFSDYEIIFDIETPFIYYKKEKEETKTLYHYPKDRIILNIKKISMR